MDLAQRRQHDPGFYKWPAWASVRETSHVGRYGFRLEINAHLLRAADLSGSITCGSLPGLYALALQVDAFDAKVALEGAELDAATALNALLPERRETAGVVAP